MLNKLKNHFNWLMYFYNDKMVDKWLSKNGHPKQGSKLFDYAWCRDKYYMKYTNMLKVIYK